jgi:hypothetical protein
MHPRTQERYRPRQRTRNTRQNPGAGRPLNRGIVALVLVVLFLLLPATAADTAGGTTNPTVIVTDYTVTPAVLLPGDRGTITLTVKNTASAATVKENSGISSAGTFASSKSTDINVYIENVHLEANGIEVQTADFDRLGELGPGQSIPVTFVIRAPAQDGIYFPEAWIDVKDGRSTRFPLTVNVNTDISTQKKPSLAVTQQLPARVAPGEDCLATITVTNTGLTRAADIAMVANSTVKSLVLTSPGRHYASSLAPGENLSFDLRFATDKNTPVGIDPVILAITYHNPDGTVERQLETLGIPVKGRAEIAVSSVTTDPVRPVPGNPFTLIIRVENTGTGRATSVRAALDSPFAGTRTAFIGSIDKDSDAPAVFYLQAAGSGAVPANLTISYNDDFGSHAVREDATVMTAPGNGLATIIVALLILGILAGSAYWYFRIRPGKQHGE